MQLSRGGTRNLDFLVRAAEWLSGGDDLLTITRREETGRLDRITDAESRYAAMTFSRRLNTFVVPALVVLAGAFLVRQRTVKLRRNSAAENRQGKGSPP